MTTSQLGRAGAAALILALLVTAGRGLFGQEPDEPPPRPVPGKLSPSPVELLPPPDEPAPATPTADAPPTPEAEKTTVPVGIDVQTRGPLHEAYAQPYDAAPQAGPVVPRQPPGPVPEEPPDQRPEGDNVLWIPGCWAWDADRSDFLWVSGCWRVPPPGRKWVPGYWHAVDDGWQWTSGFWAADTQEEAPYLEELPTPLDTGPTTPAPDDNSFYVPGCWIPRTSVRFLWRPGYWCPNRPGFVWSPARYCGTPSGYVFANGYWDYPLEDRGLPFAPVAFTQPLWDNPDWSYRPSYCVNPDGLLASLFVNPSGCNYCFGDYFTPRCRDLGYRPWFGGGRAYDNPLFNYYHWAHRDEPGWFRGLAGTYRGRFDGTLARPPHSLVAQNRLLRNPRVTNAFRDTRFAGVRDLAVNSLQTVRPLTSFRNSNVHLTRLDSTQLRQHSNLGSQFRQASRSRLAAEGKAGPREGRSAALSLARVPTGPSRHAAHTGPGHAASTLRSPAPFASGRHTTTAPSSRTGPFPRETLVGPGPRSVPGPASGLTHSPGAAHALPAYSGSRPPRTAPGVTHPAGTPHAGVNSRETPPPRSVTPPLPPPNRGTIPPSPRREIPAPPRRENPPVRNVTPPRLPPSMGHPRPSWREPPPRSVAPPPAPALHKVPPAPPPTAHAAPPPHRVPPPPAAPRAAPTPASHAAPPAPPHRAAPAPAPKPPAPLAPSRLTPPAPVHRAPPPPPAPRAAPAPPTKAPAHPKDR